MRLPLVGSALIVATFIGSVYVSQMVLGTEFMELLPALLFFTVESVVAIALIWWSALGVENAGGQLLTQLRNEPPAASSPRRSFLRDAFLRNEQSLLDATTLSGNTLIIMGIAATASFLFYHSSEFTEDFEKALVLAPRAFAATGFAVMTALIATTRGHLVHRRLAKDFTEVERQHAGDGTHSADHAALQSIARAAISMDGKLGDLSKKVDGAVELIAGLEGLSSVLSNFSQSLELAAPAMSGLGPALDRIGAQGDALEAMRSDLQGARVAMEAIAPVVCSAPDLWVQISAADPVPGSLKDIIDLLERELALSSASSDSASALLAAQEAHLTRTRPLLDLALAKSSSLDNVQEMARSLFSEFQAASSSLTAAAGQLGALRGDIAQETRVYLEKHAESLVSATSTLTTAAIDSVILGASSQIDARIGPVLDKLANQTTNAVGRAYSQAAGQLHDTMSSVAGGTRTAVVEIERVNREVVGLANAMSMLAENLEAQRGAVDRAGKSLTDAVSGLGQAASKASQDLAQMDVPGSPGLATLARELSAASAQVEHAAGSLAQMTDDLARQTVQLGKVKQVLLSRISTSPRDAVARAALPAAARKPRSD